MDINVEGAGSAGTKRAGAEQHSEKSGCFEVYGAGSPDGQHFFGDYTEADGQSGIPERSTEHSPDIQQHFEAILCRGPAHAGSHTSKR